MKEKDSNTNSTTHSDFEQPITVERLIETLKTLDPNMFLKCESAGPYALSDIEIGQDADGRTVVWLEFDTRL